MKIVKNLTEFKSLPDDSQQAYIKTFLFEHPNWCGSITDSAHFAQWFGFTDAPNRPLEENE